MAIEELEKRFGTMAVGKGFINFDQLMEALEIQEREDMEGKKHRLIGKILFDIGLMTLPQIEEVLVCIPLSATPRWGETDYNADNEDLLVTLEQSREPSPA
jgi:hypothetical protein